MIRKLVVEFTKMNGTGNDFIVLDNRFYAFSDEELAALARRFCPRRTGIGADGLLAFAPPADPAHHYRMRYVNADGSFATMCGNGARCLARFARRAGLTADPLVFETDAGFLAAHVPAEGDAPVRLLVDPPRDVRPEITLAQPVDELSFAFVWTGTEHVVAFVGDVGRVPVAAWGSAVRHDAALAPVGANVNFVQVLEPGTASGPAVLEVRTFERGVEAETLACGTGALAAAVTARVLGRIAADEVEVRMPGGRLGVGLRRRSDALDGLYLEGAAEVVFRGTVEV